jgi:phosphoglycolate phosphatase
MSRHALLLDLDGTLVDTAPDLCAVLNTLLGRHERPPLPYALARNEVSNGALGLLRAAFDDEDSPTALETLRLEFLEIYVNAICVNSRIFNGLESILDTVEEQGRPWGIVTNKPGALTERLLEALGLGPRVRCVISGDRLPERKPHPAPLALAAHELGVEPHHCVYVGDAPRDIDAGRAAGMSTIAAAYGYIRPHDDPQRWGADIVIRRPTDLLRACEKLERQARRA